MKNNENKFRSRFVHIPDEVYCELAVQFGDEIDGHRSIQDAYIEVEDAEFLYTLEISAIVTYERTYGPDGEWDMVTNVHPTSVEFHVTDADDTDYISDFDIEKLIKITIN